MSMARPSGPLPEVDVTRPHSVRIYNYWLGGKDHYAADRELGDAMIVELPSLATMAKAHRSFLERAVRHLAAEAGATQFLLLGAGLPTTYNLHQVAQEAEPLASVVYADSDPVVAAHSRALLVSHPKGTVAFVPGDTADLPALLADPALGDVLDLAAPVAVALSSSLMKHSDQAARRILDGLLDRLAPGSHLILTHPTADFDQEAVLRAMRVGLASGFAQSVRSREEFAALFAGLELVDPGVVPILAWRPDERGPQRDVHSVHLLGAVGRKP
jgi:SAM-dependent methyltransferase